MELTEQFILLQAPNPAAAENGRKLSKKGSFSSLCRTQDGTLYWGEYLPGAGKPHTGSPLTGATPIPRCAGAPVPADSFPASTPWG